MAKLPRGMDPAIVEDDVHLLATVAADVYLEHVDEAPPGARWELLEATLEEVYLSLLIEAGESVKVVQARLGHKSAVETLDTYGHLWPDNETPRARRWTAC